MYLVPDFGLNTFVTSAIFSAKKRPIFHNLNYYEAVAQWIKCSAGELKDPCSVPGQEDFFSLKFLLNRKLTKW